MAAAVGLLAGLRVGAEEKWAVHEWGTFTSLQDESGNALGGINTDDEPVPDFVHRLSSRAVLSPSETPQFFVKGTPVCHPDVTLRMETPVIYFHPPRTATGIQTVSVSVLFHGGWLSEFYPDAEVTAPGLRNDGLFGHLDAHTDSRLTWTDLKVGGDWPLTNTTERVWTAPRAVASAAVQTPGGEGEQFLFYRGVAHIDAPLRVSRNAGDELVFQSQLEALPGSQSLPVSSLWLVDIRPEGNIAFRELPALSLQRSQKILLHTPAEFPPGDFSPGNLNRLRTALQRALVAQGLYPDEAQALLNTWEVSYFKSVGERVFFLVPRAWTDFYLPLKLSRPADLQRVMVGRIELVTPKQRGILRQISGFAPGQIQHDAFELSSNYADRFFPPLADGSSGQDRLRLNREMEAVNAGRQPLAGLVPIPGTYQAYLDLGRFRNALILNQASIHPTAGLTHFIDGFRLQSYQVATASGSASTGALP